MRRAFWVDATAALLIAAVGTTLWLILSLETKLSALLWALGLLYPLQYFLAPRRRRSGDWFVQYTAMAAYYLPPILAFYAANAVYTTHTNHNYTESTPVDTTMDQALALLFSALYVSSLSGADVVNMTSYSLRDGPRHGWRFVMWIIYLSWVQWQSPSGSNPRSLYNAAGNNDIGSILLGFSVVVDSFLAMPRPPGLDLRTKEVADYMAREFKPSSSPGDDASRSGLEQMVPRCRYLFMHRIEGNRWINMKYLMQLRDSGDLQLRHVDPDFWLSYSLCLLLARRYFGFLCTEEGDEEVLDFAVAQLISDYNKAFTVVEVQLAFLHDYFFTASLRKMEWDSGMLREDTIIGQLRQFKEALMLVVASDWWATSHLKSYSIDALGLGLIDPGAPIVLILAQILYLVNLPVNRLLPKYWSPIQIAFRRLNNDLPARTSIFGRLRYYIFGPNVCARSARISFSPPPNERDFYWRNTIGQYSIERDYSRRRCFKKAAVAWFKERVLFQSSYSFIEHLPVEEEDVPVPDSVRRLVADALLAVRGPPTNGTRSLHKNMDDSASYDWSETCREQTHTDTILIWHIATCYFGMLSPQGDRQEEEHKPAYTVQWYREAATALSNYCAYLVAFLPEFLPEHSLTTKAVFQRVLKDARRLFKNNKLDIKYPPNDPRDKETAIYKGVKLGRELRSLDLRDPADPCPPGWKVMAEFWAETILYIAPSDNAEWHMEHLAQGGEFITHIWAMLSNAGILKRATGRVPPATTATESKQCNVCATRPGPSTSSS